MQRGMVSLVGAGPGDPELITCRGRRRLAEADLVLYDALAHPDLLAHCKPESERVFVGKRAGRASERQAAINERLVRAAQAGKRVVRLKGGDPYLFGRGSEEAEALAANGILFEVVPGVPSPLAATAYAGLSLTHRDLSSSVAYLTATESVTKDRSSHDWARLATATQTLVIFMGMRKLDTLMALLVEHGRPAETPAAVVHWASLPKQRTLVGTVGDIAEKAREAALGLPSLIIVGEVVTLREHLRWFDRRPLFGQRVLVTRAAHQAGSMAERLREAGAEALVAPTLRLVPPDDPAPLEGALEQLATYDWVVLTSANAVGAVFEGLRGLGRDARRFGTARVAVIGDKTALALRAHGIHADLVATSARGEGMRDTLREVLSERSRILLPRAAVAREVLPEALRGDGHHVDIVSVYETRGPDESMLARVREACAEANAITYTSGSTVDQLVDAVGIGALQGKVHASIGPVTSDALRQHGLEPHAEATKPEIPRLVEALAAYYEREA